MLTLCQSIARRFFLLAAVRFIIADTCSIAAVYVLVQAHKKRGCLKSRQLFYFKFYLRVYAQGM